MNENIEFTAGKVIYRTGLHWALLLGPAMVIFLGRLMLDSKGPQAVVVMAFGALWGLTSFINLRRSQILLTADRLIFQTGFPLKKTYNLPLEEISEIQFYQPTLGSILNFGKIMLVQKNMKRNNFRFVPRPAELVNAVQEAILSLRQNAK
ncbi:MAG TPA: PH domain-containing protein [Thermodesulfobacteriota bacterium]|nr:PH domain-containing protein [Thermodesulfobacteriota bacterium]